LVLGAGPAKGEIKDAIAVDNYTVGFYTEAALHEFGSAVTFDVAPGGSYAGLGSRVVDTTEGSYLDPPEQDRIYRDTTPLDPPYQGRTAVFLGTEFVIKAGTNTSEAWTTVNMAWRTRVEIEVDTRGYDMDGLQMPPAAWDSYGMNGDIVEITGMAGAYVLEAEYDEASLVFTQPEYTEAQFAATDKLYLGWLEDEEHKSGGTLPDKIEWVHATEGNIGSGTVVANYQGSYDDFVAEHAGFTVAGYLGSYGVDIEDNTVWAIVDHNSQFGAVPEPATIALLVLGGLAVIRRGKK